MVMVVPDPGQVHKALGGQIEVRVEVDTGLAGSSFMLWDVGEWDVDLWGSEDPDWADTTEFVESIEINQGTERWGQRFETGSATMILDNTDGRFTPDSGFKPFHLPFRPGRRIRVVAIPDPDSPLDKEPQFTGVIDSIVPVFDEGGFLITVQLNCLDFMKLWAGHDPPALVSPTGVQDTHERVATALDRMDWPDDADHRDIQTGQHTMQTSSLAQTTLEECQRAADAEGGHFYCSKDGKATFKARDWLILDTRSSEVQGYLGFDEVPTGSNSAHVEDVQMSWELDRVFNDVQFSRVGGSMQQAEDETSQGIYDIRSYPRTDLENNTDAEVLFLAERYLGQFKTDRIRIDAITISANADPDNEDLNRLIWDSQFGDLLSVKAQTPYGWAIEKLVKIMGISHRITAEDWEVTFKLDDVFIDLYRDQLMLKMAPLAWWRFNDTSPFTDHSGNERHLAILGASTGGGAAFTSDESMSFDGTDDYAELDDPGDLAAFILGEFSIECWVRPHTDGVILYCSDDDGSTTDARYMLLYGDPDNGPGASDLGDFHTLIPGQFAFYSEISDSEIYAEADVNEWHHVVVTAEADGIAQIYLNGDPVDSTNFGSGGTTPELLYIAASTGWLTGATPGFYFDGEISEITIFDRVLTSDEVQELYESTYG